MEDKKKTDNLIQYGLKTIHVNKYSYTMPIRKVAEDEKIGFNYNITPNVKYNLKENLILVFMQIDIVIRETTEKLVEAEFAFIYSANDLNSFVELEEETQIWKFKDEKNEGLIVTLIGVSLSTARGILFEKTRGTIIESGPLPIMNPSVFVKKAK